MPYIFLGADSAQRFSAKAAKDAGITIGARYINQSFNANELADYQRNNLVLLPIYEEDGRPGDNDNIPEDVDYQDGLRQGRRAKQILDGLGIGDYGCAFTDDVSGQPYPAVKKWAQGVRAGFPNHFVFYGPAHIGDQLCDENIADSVWIEGAFSFSVPYRPGTAPTARHACGIQFPGYIYVGGVTCDKNHFYSTPWLPGHSLPHFPSIPGEDELNDEDLTKLADKVSTNLAPALGLIIAGEVKLGQNLPPKRATKQDGVDPQQYYLVDGPDGYPRRVKVKNEAQLALYKKLGYVDDVELEPLDGNGANPLTAEWNDIPVAEPAP